MKINRDTIIKRNPDMVSSDMDGEKVMMSIENGEYYALDPVGSEIWDNIEDEIKIDDLIKKLISQFDVSEETCEKDTMEFLNELLGKKLITIIK